MYVRLHTYKLKNGEPRFAAYAVVKRNEQYSVGTFETAERARIAGKIFLFWCDRYPDVNRHRLKNFYFTR